jgi:hypothetical protein
VPFTGHRERYEWIALEVPVPEVLAGRLTLACTPISSVLRIDQVAVLGAAQAPSPAWSPAVHRRGDLEIRASTEGRVFDPPWVFSLLERNLRYLEPRFGQRLEGGLVLVAVAAADWPLPGAGAFQESRFIYLPDAQLHLGWHSYPHEVFHVLQEQCPVRAPWFFHEGAAFVAALEAERELWGRDDLVEERVAGFAELFSRGNALFRPGVDARNPVFVFGEAADGEEPGPTAEPAGPSTERTAYEWAYAIVWSLVRDLGPDLVSRVYAELAKTDSAPVAALQREPDPWKRAGHFVEVLGLATGQDLGSRFQDLGLVSRGPELEGG